MGVGEDLDLDVPRAVDEPLDQQGVVAEGGRASRRAACQGDRQLVGRADQPHALAAAAGRRLDQHREADPAPAPPMSSSSVIPGRPAPGTTGTPAAATVALALILSPIASMAAGGGPMKTSPASRRPGRRRRSRTGTRSRGGWPARRPGAPRRGSVDVQVALGGRRRADPDRLVGLARRAGRRRRRRCTRRRCGCRAPRSVRMTRTAISPAVGDQDRGRTCPRLTSGTRRSGPASSGALAAADRARPEDAPGVEPGR